MLLFWSPVVEHYPDNLNLSFEKCTQKEYIMTCKYKLGFTFPCGHCKRADKSHFHLATYLSQLKIAGVSITNAGLCSSEVDHNTYFQ